MSHGHEPLEVIEPYLYSTLAGDPYLASRVNDRIINTLAAAGVDDPYIVFAQAQIRDRRMVSGVRLWVDAVYDVKAVMQTASWKPMQPLAARFDELFDRQGEVVQTAGGNLEIWRERLISYPEMVQGVQFRHLGAQYHVRAYIP